MYCRGSNLFSFACSTSNMNLVKVPVTAVVNLFSYYIQVYTSLIFYATEGERTHKNCYKHHPLRCGMCAFIQWVACIVLYTQLKLMWNFWESSTELDGKVTFRLLWTSLDSFLHCIFQLNSIQSLQQTILYADVNMWIWKFATLLYTRYQNHNSVKFQLHPVTCTTNAFRRMLASYKCSIFTSMKLEL